MDRDHPTPAGACARLTWLSGDPAAADSAIDIYRMAVLPRLQEMDGFCSSSLMIDRSAGRVVGTAAFDGVDSLVASRDSAGVIRQRAAEETRATISNVEEMEIAFAHLHMPEMA